MFQKERFIEKCCAALKEKETPDAVRELVTRAESDPEQIVAAFGEARRAGVKTLYRADDLTILNLCWGPRMKLKPHDHRMWAVIGIYAGCEQNIFYRRVGQGLEQQGTKELHAKDTVSLGVDAIHTVVNPMDQVTAAIHVYGGDFFATPRSEWDPETFEERPYDVEDTLRVFEEPNKRLRGMLPR
jgi:predicted metal-dependent enzyme (double-stranded beta helix superfamily)